MDIRHLTPDHAVSPQIAPEDMPLLAEAGFTHVICNRPDAENPESHQADAMRAAAEAAGLQFTYLPVVHGGFTAEILETQAGILAQEKTLAYCASGTRCSIVWSLGRAGLDPVDTILATAAQAGYDLSQLRPTLSAATPKN